MDGDHTIDESYHVTERTLRAVFTNSSTRRSSAKGRC